MPTVAVVEPELYRLKQLSVEIVISEIHVLFLILLVLYSIQLYVIYISFTLPSQSLPTYISHQRTNLRPVTSQVAPPGRTGEALATVGVGDAQDGCGWRGGGALRAQKGGKFMENSTCFGSQATERVK